MFRITILTLCASMLISAAPALACTGPNPAIEWVKVQSVVPQGGENRFMIAANITNLGSAQPLNVLQYVSISAYGQRLDRRSIPPLRAGQSFSFIYPYFRSTQSGRGTSTLDFQIVMTQGVNCNPNNGHYSLTF
jgi:hypothetical protein